MKILMITEKDSANVSLAKIANAFLKKSHEVIIYALYYEKSVLRFFDKRILRFPLDDLTEDMIHTFDIVFASSVANSGLINKNLLSAHKPIFTQNYLVDKQVQWGGDFCFVPSLASTATIYDKYLNYSRIEIGEPKYDCVRTPDIEHRRFLFIDSGHYPFGEEGKRELARTLLDICESFWDYELWIKPRFLPEDQVITHKNSIQLCDMIENVSGGKIPKNLIMLQEHKDLSELIEQSSTVLCMYTTAFVGAYALGKGLVVLDGLPSEDVYDVRWKTFQRIRDNMADSGAVVDYRAVKEVLPQGVKCSDSYFRYLLAEKENIAEKICEMVEYIYKKYYQMQKFPQICECAYQDYKSVIQEAVNFNWDKVVFSRYTGCLLQRMLSLIDYHINAPLNVESLFRRIEEIREGAYHTDATFKKMIKNVYLYRDECIVENTEAMMADDIDSGILLNAFYNLKKYDEIINFSKKSIGAYYLFRAFVEYERKESAAVIEDLEQYMRLSLHRAYIKEISDMSNNRFKAFYILIKCLAENGKKQKAFYYLNEMKAYYEQLYPKSSEIIEDCLQRQHYDCLHRVEIEFFKIVYGG